MSVIGLAPIRPGLKDRLLDLLCIHGQKNRTQGDETHRVAHSQMSLNPVVSNPPWRWKDALPLVGTRLVSEQRTEGRDDRDEPGIHEILNHCFNVFVGGRGLFVEQVPLSTDHAAAQ